MANEEHLAILRQGVEVWNAWRQENPCIKPDLSGAHLEWIKLFRIDLSDTIMNDVILASAQLDAANFSRAQLMRAKFASASLAGAIFSEVNLAEANFEGVKLWGANFREARLINSELD
jgi:uncharacterized protein YjbI with pentapeptide repeats